MAPSSIKKIKKAKTSGEKIHEPDVDYMVKFVNPHRSIVLDKTRKYTEVHKNVAWGNLALLYNDVDELEQSSEIHLYKIREIIESARTEHCEFTRARRNKAFRGGPPPKPLSDKTKWVISIVGEGITGLEARIGDSDYIPPHLENDDNQILQHSDNTQFKETANILGRAITSPAPVPSKGTPAVAAENNDQVTQALNQMHNLNQERKKYYQEKIELMGMKKKKAEFKVTMRKKSLQKQRELLEIESKKGECEATMAEKSYRIKLELIEIETKKDEIKTNMMEKIVQKKLELIELRKKIDELELMAAKWELKILQK